MKKLLLSTAATLLTVAAFAQGTVAFSNGTFNKISTGEYGSAPSTWVVLPTTAGLFNFGCFYGVGATAPATLTFLSSTIGQNSITSPGVIKSSTDANITGLQIPGTTVGQADVWIQIQGWSSSFGTDWAAAQAASLIGNGAYFGTTGAAINVGPLGPTTGPGIPFWTTAAGTNPALHPGGIALFTTVPEPTTMTLAGLGIAALMIFRRRK